MRNAASQHRLSEMHDDTQESLIVPFEPHGRNGISYFCNSSGQSESRFDALGVVNPPSRDAQKYQYAIK